jgi:hypothetical protein
MEQFIRAKYEQKKWIDKNWRPSPITIPPNVILDLFAQKKSFSNARLLNFKLLKKLAYRGWERQTKAVEFGTYWNKTQAQSFSAEFRYSQNKANECLNELAKNRPVSWRFERNDHDDDDKPKTAGGS